MAQTATPSALAVNGGPRTFTAMHGKKHPKIGVDEFMAVARRFGFKQEALERIRQTVSNDDLLEDGPTLSKYATAFPEPAVGLEFEALAREKFGVKYALGVSSGTGALHAAFVAAGVGPGTEVILPALGFAATAAAVVVAGGIPVFCDIDRSLHIDPAKITALISPRTVVISPTHHWGGVSDMGPILELARESDLRVIEDCAQSPGATYKGRFVGTIGDIGCFSISAYKIIGGGEGGLVVTDDERLFERINQLAEFGGLWRPDRFAPPRYDGELFAGTNYRMSEMEAAVDLVQLGKLDDVVRRYRTVSRGVRSRLDRFREITPQKSNDPDGSIGYLLRFFPESLELSAKITEAIQAEGIACRTRGKDHAPDWHLYAYMYPVILKAGHIPGGSVFEDSRYIQRGGDVRYGPGDCPVAEDLFAREVSIPLNEWYDAEDCANITAGINKVLAAYCTPDSEAGPWM